MIACARPADKTEYYSLHGLLQMCLFVILMVAPLFTMLTAYGLIIRELRRGMKLEQCGADNGRSQGGLHNPKPTYSHNSCPPFWLSKTWTRMTPQKGRNGKHALFEGPETCVPSSCACFDIKNGRQEKRGQMRCALCKDFIGSVLIQRGKRSRGTIQAWMASYGSYWKTIQRLGLDGEEFRAQFQEAA